ncbi:MAG: metallophosphoesterase [Clostridia bacterium]|nr:metallophosphoesterase [Clostridia bacterium]
MNEIKFLHCADLHLGASCSYLGAKAKKRRMETLLTFEKIIDTAQENRVDFLLIAGDLLDSNTVEAAWIDRVFDGFRQIPEIEIIYAAGNHDPLDATSPFRTKLLPDNVHILGTADTVLHFPRLHTDIYGRSFGECYLTGEERFSLPTDLNAVSLMVQHGDFPGSSAGNYNPITPDFIKTSGMDYIALGHIHQRTDLQQLGGTAFSYCGCPEGQGFDESGEKGVYLGTVAKGNCSLQFIPLAKRRHERMTVDISPYETTAETATAILQAAESLYGEDYAENLYRITLTGALAENQDLSMTELSARLNDILYFAKVKNRTTVQADLAVLANEPSLKGIFVRKMLSALSQASETDRPTVEAALQLGLRAFRGEVDDFDTE